MKKLTILMICCALMLAGCNNNGSSKSVSSEEPNSKNDDKKFFDIDKIDLESKGYENLADIAYGKIDEIEGKTTVFLTYYQNEPEISFYLAAKIMQLLDNNANLLITWDKKDYDINEEKMNKVGKDNFESIFPNDWHDVIKKSLSTGNSIEDFISKSSSDMIDKVTQKFVSKYLEDNQEKVISQKEYKIDEEKISISLKEKNDKTKINAYGHAKTEEKACLMLTVFKTSFDKLSVDEYSITIFCGELFLSYAITDGEIYISGSNKDGSLALSMPDWVVSEFTMPQEEMDSYASEMLSILKEFGGNMEQ